ncbi:MAG: hypothetical protein HYR60_02245 [Acidobacteria bacterium]|nr:hypothetical protein [Acidobacteriota bacterium]
MRALLVILAVSLSAAAQVRMISSIPSPEQSVQDGAQMSPGAAELCEQQLEKDPNDLTARAKLIGYYFYQWMRAGEERSKAARRRHILWTIQHRPEHPLAALYESILDPKGTSLADPPAYQEARRLWLSHLETRSGDVAAAGNVGKYFQLNDRELAERGYKQALAIDPRNGEWQWRLGFLYGLAILGVDALAFNGQPASIDPLAQQSPFTAKARKELETSASPLLVAVAGNILARYGTMLAASEKSRIEHLEEAEKLYRRAQMLDPNNPSWKQMLQEAQALKIRMQVSDPPSDGRAARPRPPGKKP